MSKNLEFLIIDPQNSFCHPINGELFVPGADQDMSRLAQLIQRHIDTINDIHVTMDMHHELDVAHPLFWVDAQGNHPLPFAGISADDVRNGVWRPFNPSIPSQQYGTLGKRMIAYVESLEANGRYQLTIWPPHCRIGSPGSNIYEPVYDALRSWEVQRYAMVDYVTKGSNIFTEHYSGVQADVPDPEDPTTHLNTDLIKTLEKADLIYIAGEASSHCISNTIYDIVSNFGEDTMKKCHLITDCMSPVPGFEHLADAFFHDMSSKGLHLVTSSDLMS